MELFRRSKIATMPELKEALGTDVDVTVFRKLKELGYRTSYSHRGGYYTLKEISLFNDLGLWSFRSVWFSRYGTLVSTCEAFVSGSAAGYFAEELDNVLHVEAKAALLSYSNFGSRDGATAFKMRETYRRLKAAAPDMIVEGEMQGDLAMNEDLRSCYIPDSVLGGEANLLLFPNLDSANLSMTLLKEMNNALAVGPILMGPRAPAHILAPSTTSRGIVNMTAIAASEAVALGERVG